MRTIDFAPLYRSTVGFDRLFDTLDRTDAARLAALQYREEGRKRIPHHHGDRRLRPRGRRSHPARRAAAGHRPKKAEQENANLLHHGIAQRGFKQTFNLADHVKVAAADLENGLLSIDLVREMPEQLKPRKIQLGSSEPALLRGRTTSQKQVESAGVQKQAA